MGEYKKNYLAHYGVKGMKWGKRKNRVKFENGGIRIESGKDYTDPNFGAAGVEVKDGRVTVYNTKAGMKDYTDDKALKKKIGRLTIERAEDGTSATISRPGSKKDTAGRLGEDVVKSVFEKIKNGNAKKRPQQRKKYVTSGNGTVRLGAKVRRRKPQRY